MLFPITTTTEELEICANLQAKCVMAGMTAYVYGKEQLDLLVAKLQSMDGHKGVVISGCRPFNVTVNFNEIHHNEMKSGCYYKCISGSIKDEIIFCYEISHHCLLNTNDYFPDDYEYCTFIEVKPNWRT